MAQTKRKRRSKHRGTAAGTIESRGRTGRPPTEQERKAAAREARMAKMDRPPTWRSAANRAAIAAAVFIVAVVLLFGQDIGAAVSLGAFMLLLYIPLGYYTDLIIYRRRQAKKLKGRAGG